MLKEKVIEIMSGDCFVTEESNHPVRIVNYFAPTPNESGYDLAKARLQEAILSKHVHIKLMQVCEDNMRYGLVWVDGQDVADRLHSMFQRAKFAEPV